MLATGGYLAIQDLITPGTMIAASIIMGRALAPVELAVGQWKNFVASRNAFARLKQLVEQYPEQEEKMALPAPTGRVDLQNIFLRPPGSETIIINNVAMSLEPGSVTGIIGPSGSGNRLWQGRL